MRTLRNAIEQDKVHHAYLFVGSRGTGKTSMAKILAASLNCEHGGPTVDARAATASPAARSPSATSLDVIEMDAASNNSVDDIRDLRERVAYAPVSGRHKVYILDEAHMLSHAGVERVPQDARGAAAAHDLRARDDRGQQGAADGRRPLPPLRLRAARRSTQIAGVLRRVADAEGIEIADEAVALIARSATGSFRDALGTLEQLVTYSGTTIALEDVLAVLGVADADLLFGDRRRGRLRRRARGAAGRRAARRLRPRRRPLLRRPRGARARADGRADARRRGPGRAAR